MSPDEPALIMIQNRERILLFLRLERFLSGRCICSYKLNKKQVESTKMKKSEKHKLAEKGFIKLKKGRCREESVPYFIRV